MPLFAKAARRACLRLHLQLDYCVDKDNIPKFSLALYVAECWDNLARFRDIQLIQLSNGPHWH